MPGRLSTGLSCKGDDFAPVSLKVNTNLSCCLCTSCCVSEDIPCCKKRKPIQDSFVRSHSLGSARPTDTALWPRTRYFSGTPGPQDTAYCIQQCQPPQRALPVGGLSCCGFKLQVYVLFYLAFSGPQRLCWTLSSQPVKGRRTMGDHGGSGYHCHWLDPVRQL